MTRRVLNDASAKAGVGRRLEVVYSEGIYYFNVTPDGTSPNVPSGRGSCSVGALRVD